MQRSLLRDKRVELGLTVQQVANEIKIGRSYLGKIEQGRMNPSLYVAIRIAEFYNVEVAEFKQIFKRDGDED